MIKGVLFDLDGTLINTNELIVSSYMHTFKNQLGLDVSRNKIISYFGEPLKYTLNRFCSEDQLPRLVDCYRKYNIENHDNLTKSFPGVYQALEILKKELNLSIAVVTSKMRDTAERGLNLFNLYQFIDVLVGFEDTVEHKPKPGPVFKALEILKIEANEVLMVGDSPFDVLCAHNANVCCGIVKYSIFDVEALEKTKPDFWISNLLDLPHYIKCR
jgi:pyrophosphatase PpaX